MLILYDDELFDRKIDIPIVRDVESLFARTRIKDCEEIRNFIKEIDKGTFCDESRFIDRFNTKVYLSELSTGCKAAICVYCYPNKIIDLLECGVNARDSIIKNCKQGSVIFYKDGYSIGGMSDDIDVSLNGKAFKTMSDLNEYIDSYDYYYGG